MEKCLYNGNVLYAYEVLRDFGFEQEIRKCPSLTCYDCGASVFFRHGKQRAECFVHRHKEECRYGEYCKKQSDIFRYVQREFADHLQRIAVNRGFQIEEDVVIIPEHYTAFVLHGPSRSFAIDIIDCITTAATLEKRKKFYEQNGYWYLQITVDKNAEIAPFYERDMAYFPVKFALNQSLNNTALVIDKEHRDWCIYILDKAQLSEKGYNIPTSLFEDTLALKISLDDIDIDDRGFFTINSTEKFIGFCKRRKQSAAEWVSEQKIRAEQQRQREEKERKRVEQRRIENERLAEKLKLQRQQAEEAQKKNEQEVREKREAEEKSEIHRLHNETGGYIGAKEKGVYKVHTLEEITARRPSQNWLAIYTQKHFEDRIRDMQQFKQAGVSQLFAKMCFITPEETTLLLKLHTKLKENGSEIVADLEFLMRKAGIKYE